MQETQVIQLDGESKVALVFGQMNEPPGARARVALTGYVNSRGISSASNNSRALISFFDCPKTSGTFIKGYRNSRGVWYFN